MWRKHLPRSEKLFQSKDGTMCSSSNLKDAPEDPHLSSAPGLFNGKFCHFQSHLLIWIAISQRYRAPWTSWKISRATTPQSNASVRIYRIHHLNASCLVYQITYNGPRMNVLKTACFRFQLSVAANRQFHVKMWNCLIVWIECIYKTLSVTIKFTRNTAKVSVLCQVQQRLKSCIKISYQENQTLCTFVFWFFSVSCF